MTEATGIRCVKETPGGKNALAKNFLLLLLLSVTHLPFGVFIYSLGPFAILHPIGVFCIGIYWALNKRYGMERVALAIAYFIGAEVLWRMVQIPVFWEFGKYGASAIALVALGRRGLYAIPKLPIIYFAALIPACLLTLIETDFSSAQASLSAQISGPFFLVVACWFFSYCKFDPKHLRRLLIALIVPLFSVAVATIFFTFSTEDIQFNGESNLATSGGFGPNQVSAILGLGVFVCLSCLLIFQNAIRYRIFLLTAAFLFSAQCVMTFSRGGIYNAIGAIVVVLLVEFQRPSVVVKRLVPIVGLVLLFSGLVFPALDGFTGGLLKERFEDTETTGRTEIAGSDIQLFLANPLLGVGVGSSYGLRENLLSHKAMTHTEFSRLLSEHGMFGVAALILLAGMIITSFLKQRTTLGRALVAGGAVWACLFMTNAAMRLAAPSFMLGLMYATIVAYERIRWDFDHIPKTILKVGSTVPTVASAVRYANE